MKPGLRPIPGFEGYFAGSDGNIYSTRVGNRLKRLVASPSTNGYYHGVVLRRDGQSYSKNVHRLVAESWLGPPPEGAGTSHLDGNSHNNKPDNLAWESQEKNIRRKQQHGTTDRGLRNSRSKFTEADIHKIRAMYHCGMSQKDIAAHYRVWPQTISKIITGVRYGEVK